MTHVVNDACVNCKFTTCVSVCPVDCFHEGSLMVAINPDKCIDCGLCVPECPVKAIEPESKENFFFLKKARENIKKWPVITEMKAPLKDAEKYLNQKDKYKRFIKE